LTVVVLFSSAVLCCRLSFVKLYLYFTIVFLIIVDAVTITSVSLGTLYYSLKSQE